MTPVMLFWLTFAPALLAVLIGLVADMLGGRTAKAGTIGAGVLLVCGGVVGLVGGYAFGPGQVYGPFSSGVAFSAVPGLVLALAGVCVIVLAGRTARRQGQTAALVALTASGSALAVASTDLVALALSLEIAAVSAYALVAVAGTRRASEAAVKYFVQGAVATGLVLVGTGVLVGAVRGGGEYRALAQGLQAAPVPSSLAALIAVAVGLAVKAGAAPFHSWAPDAYESAEPEAAAALAGAGKLGAVSALAVLAVGLASSVRTQGSVALGLSAGIGCVPALSALAVASVLVGSLAALRQRSYTRMLGYAGVAQVGYALIAAASMSAGGAILLVATYAVATTGVFVAAGTFRALRPDWDGTIEGLSGVGRQSRLVGLSVTVLLMSLAGIPPLVGFWGKFQAFGSAVAMAVGMATGHATALEALYIALASVGVVGSVVSLGYYGAVVRALYSASPRGAEDAEYPDQLAGPALVWPSEAGVGGAVVTALALVVIAAGVVPLVVGIQPLVSAFMLGR